MTDLVDTTEMYLRTILDLEEEGIVPLRARIAERLGHSGPTVSQTVARMERDGLLIVSGDRHLELTEEGYAKAVSVMRKHRLAERLLTDVIRGDQTLFMHRDEVEQAWTWVDPIIAGWQDYYPHPHRYAAGSWGPSQAIGLIERDGRSWADPDFV